MVMKERRAGNGGDSGGREQAHGLLFAVAAGQARRVGEDVVRALGNAGREANLFECGAEQIALVGVLAREVTIEVGGELVESGGDGVLKGRGRADVGEVVEVSDGRGPARVTNCVAETPASDAESLRET